MNNKGFTLIELIGTMIILVLIAFVGIPKIIDALSNGSKKFNDGVNKTIFQAADEYIEDNINNYPKVIGNVYCISLKTLANASLISKELKDPKTDKIYDYEKMVEIKYEESNSSLKSIKEKTGCVHYNSLFTGDYDLIKDVNRPVLVEGLTPIKWVGDLEFETTYDDSGWYDYKSKKWANAKSADGSYWVWIPRFAYKIKSGFASNEEGNFEIKFLKGTSNNYGPSDVEALSNGSNGTSESNFVLHSAFSFGSKNLKGFWVSKFEASKSGNVAAFKPGLNSWTSVSIAEAYNASNEVAENYDTFGLRILETDSHLIKNKEWGAVSYLAFSKYGKNSKIWSNNTEGKTGCAGDNIEDTITTSCENQYFSPRGEKASTTSNITGVYDMVGGALEFTSAVADYNQTSVSYLNFADLPNLISSDNENFDIYQVSTASSYAYNQNKNKWGDALYETSSLGQGENAWYNSLSNHLTTSNPWLLRGAHDGIFSYKADTGAQRAGVSFRTTLTKK